MGTETTIASDKCERTATFLSLISDFISRDSLPYGYYRSLYVSVHSKIPPTLCEIGFNKRSCSTLAVFFCESQHGCLEEHTHVYLKF